jgi:hypothetical protein
VRARYQGGETATQKGAAQSGNHATIGFGLCQLVKMMRVVPCQAFVLHAFVCGLLLASAAEAGDTKVTLASTTGERGVLDRVVAHWREREARIKSFSFAWDMLHQPSSREDNKQPAGRGELWMEGDRRYRVVYTPPKRNSTRGPSGPFDRIARWQHQLDGATHRSLNDKLGVGRIWQEDGDDIGEAGPLLLAPLMLAVRPASHGGFDRSLTGWHVAGQNAVLENRHCLKLRVVDEDSEETLWVDPNRDDVIVGWARGLPDWSNFATIEYRHSSAGWIPVGWTEIEEAQRGQPRYESFLVARSINQPIEPKLLALGFPPGTTVLDKTRNERYVVAKDGSKANVLTFDTPRSLELSQRLEAPVEFALPRVPLKDGLRLLGGRFIRTARLDAESVKKGLIDPNCPVELRATRAPLKDFVRRILDQSPKPLTYQLREGEIVVVPASAEPGG